MCIKNDKGSKKARKGKNKNHIYENLSTCLRQKCLQVDLKEYNIVYNEIGSFSIYS